MVVEPRPGLGVQHGIGAAEAGVAPGPRDPVGRRANRLLAGFDRPGYRAPDSTGAISVRVVKRQPGTLPWHGKEPSGVFAHLVMALVFKSSQGLFRFLQPAVKIRRKSLPIQVLSAVNCRVDIVGGNVKIGVL